MTTRSAKGACRSADGMIFTVSGTAEIPGTRTTARRVGGKTVRLGQNFVAHPVVIIPHRRRHTRNAAHDGLRRFQNGRWEIVEELPPGGFPQGPIKALNLNGPPWLLLDHHRNTLWRLTTARQGENPRLSRVQVEMRGGAHRA